MPANPASPIKPTSNSLDSFQIYGLKNYLLRCDVHDKSVFRLDYSFVWIQQDNAEVFIDCQPFSIDSNVLVFLRPGQQFRCTSEVTGNGFIVSFAADFLDLHEINTTNYLQKSLFNHLLVTPVVKLNDEMISFMHHAATKMHDEFMNASPYKQEILKGFLKIFIIYASRAANISEHSFTVPKKVALVQQFYMLIETHFASKKLVREYARMLHVSASYLNEAVREISSATASYHIQQRIIREAKRKIYFEGSSMKEIAFSLGFSDQAHFSKYFKNISGKNFTDFKNEVIS